MSKIQNIEILKWSEKNIDYTAIAGDNILVTAMGITITLPASPVIGDTVQVANGIAYTTSYYTTFNIASTKMFSVEARKTFYFKNYQYMTFVYQDSTVGWVYYNDLYYSNVFDSVSNGLYASLFRKYSDGSAWSWGDNTYGQLGNNTRTSYSSPVSVVGGISFSIVDCGSRWGIGIRGSDGTAWTWGYNAYGELGVSAAGSFSSPKSVVGNISFIQITGGANHNVGIRGSDGTAWCWGLNTYGNLGTNSIISRSSPVSVVGNISFIQITRSTNSSAGIRGSDGTVWCWGDNTYGELGDNSRTNRSSPVSVVGGISFTKLSSGKDCSIGIRGSDGTAWAWGRNDYGGLGDNSRTSRSSPTSVVGGISFKEITCGNYFFIGIRGSDGTAWGCGSNTYGELGTNNATSYSSPTSVVGGISFTNIYSIYYHVISVRVDKTTWCWGDNSYGELGDNTRTNRSSPVFVLGGIL